MLIVAAQHSLSGELAKQCVKRIEITGGRPFANRDLASRLHLVERLVLSETLMVSRNSRRDVLCRLLAAQTRRMSVHRLSSIMSRFHFREACCIAIKNAGKIHHLTEIQNSRVVEQRL